ncbi:unnamed protein product [Phytomonas sp. Hart1]|nr:unnamed protein product [Phytomonas sp. Hart1]|eukprot:CCW67074.1 unnamed protein product [Phytomonas sp. isolate Hart1]
MSIVYFNMGSSKKATATSLLMNPWVVLLITIAVRVIASLSYDMLEGSVDEPLMFHPPRKITLSSEPPGSKLELHSFAYHAVNGERTAAQSLLRFAIVSAPLDAAVWRDIAFFRARFPDAGIPYHLLSVAPWYTRYLPPFLAFRPWPMLWLSLCDGLTAFLMAGWPSCTSALLYVGFVLNPLMFLPTVCESIMPLEWFLLAITVEGCRCRRRNIWIFLLALLASVVLGSSFLGVLVMLLYPIGTSSRYVQRCSAVAFCFLVGIYALLYHYYTEETFKHSSTFAPPDHSTLWYVRQAAFLSLERCLEITFIILPAVILLPTTMAIPPFAITEISSSKHIPLVADVKVSLLGIAIGISVLYRNSFTIPFCCLVVLIMYSNLRITGATGEPAALTRNSVDSFKSPVKHSYGSRLDMFVPIYGFLITVPAVWGFYLAYGIWEVLNMNWIFFFNMSFLFCCVAYLYIWMNAIISDIIERKANEKPEAI